ncbi:MAG: MFS transporter [Actinomycetota bacterium]|nr:MFS transporter [Actinomycetota bacterium]
MKVTTEAVFHATDVAPVLRPRDGLVLEAPAGDGAFTQQEGPFRHYRRTVTARPTPGEPGVRVTQTVEFHLGLPYFSALLGLPLRWALGRLRPERHRPWWAPPERLDRRAAEVLATVCALAVVIGFVGSLLSLTMTYAAAEFGASRADQGVALGAVRANVVLALGILALADRRGRRRLILACAGGAVGLTSLGALAPSLVWLALTQILAVALTAALLILVGVMTAEEMPAGSRAWALAVLTMAVGFGGGLATAALPVAGIGTRGWRWPYAGALVFLPLVASARRHLPESWRWQRAFAAERPPAHRSHARRLLLLCTGGFLFSLFVTPSGQFQNEYLRTERAFSAARIAEFSLICGTIGGLGVLLGGRLADLRGRRLVAVVGAGGGIVTTLALYLSRGWPLWAWGIADSLLAYGVAPALGVYGPELFPTWQRSRSTGVVAAAYAAGGVVGLVTAGALSGHFGTFAPAFAVLAIGPALLVVLIVTAYPETAKRPLEELNPDDSGP